MINEDILKSANEKLANAYIREANRLQQAQSQLLNCIIAREEKGKYVPAFSPDVADYIKEFTDAESRVANIEGDINEIVGLIGEFKTVDALRNALYRTRRMIESAEREARIAISKASISEGEGALENPQVQKVLDARDKVRAETGTILKDLEFRVGKINTISDKF